MITYLFLISAYFFVGVDNAKSSETSESDFITSEILRLEALRIIDNEAYRNGLKQLANEQGLMSDYQVCHYNFLQAYQVAFMGDFQQAIDDVKHYKTDCENLRVRIRMDALLANLYALSGDYKNSSLAMDSTINNTEKTEDLKTKGIAYSAASMVYNLLDQKQLSIKYGEILLALEPTIENQCRLQYMKNFYHLGSTNTVTDFEPVDYADNACIESNNLLFAQSILLNSIKRKLNTETLTQASVQELSQLINQLRPEINVGPYKNIQAQFAAIEAEFALLQGDMAGAKQFSLETIAINEGLGNTEQLIMALGVLEKVALSENDYAEAHQHLNKKYQVELSLYDQSLAKQMAFMTVKHTNLSKSLEIEQLNKQKDLLVLEKKLAKQEANNHRLIILLILTLLALLTMWLLRIKKRHDYFRNVSEIDHLTKVLTRKAFEEQAAVLIKRMAREETPVHMVIMDLDHFKKVNDNHGHLIGDWVLKHVVYACKEQVEGEMIIARLGGEEFCVVMPEMDFNQMSTKVEAFRLAVEALDCSESGAEISITASFGVSSSTTSGYSMNMLLTHADVALFEAKKRGRNQVSIFSPVVT